MDKETTLTGPSRTETPLIVTHRPSISSLQHQDSVELDDWEDASDGSSSSSFSPRSPFPSRSPSPSRSAAYPSSSSLLTDATEKKKKKEKKTKKRRFLFRRKKKAKSAGDVLYPGDGADDDSGLKDLAAILVDPSVLRKGSLPITRFNSDSAVHHVGLDVVDVEDAGPISLSPSVTRRQSQQTWLVHITLESGHGLAIRDRTGTSDPYVKFKCGQFKYRSTVVNRNLNPEWNEGFSFTTSSLHQPLEVNVYDHDYGSLDDYMGGGTVSLESYTRGQLHIVDIGLNDPNAREKSLGFIRIFLSITAHVEEPDQPGAVPQIIQEWNSVLTIHLLKGNDLPPMDDNGFSDPYCKFKLGRQKRRSKVVTRSLNPHWKQKFDLRMCRGESTTLHIEVWDRDLLHPDDFIGETSVKLDTLTQEQTHDLTLPLQGNYIGNNGTIHLLLTITGTAVQEVDRDTTLSTQSSWLSPSATDTKELMKKYLLSRSLSFDLWNDIGHLTVLIDRVEGLGRNSDAFAIAEVGNSQARTHTVYKTATPFWGKAFHFDIRDIHSPLEVSVYIEKNKPELLGRIKIPLLRLEPGVNRGYVLKDKRCLEAAKGVLYLKCELVYQPVRAGLRTLKPRECKLMEKEAPFQRKVLGHNIKRIKVLINELSAGMVWMRHIYNWENKLHSTLALIGFIVGCLVGQFWMVPFLLLLVFLVQYAVIYRKGRHRWQLREKRQSSTLEDTLNQPEEWGDDWSDLEDDLEDVSEEKGGKEGKKNLRDKFRQIQGILLIVQNVLGEIADTGERINNLFAWKVPFLCWLSIALLSITTIVALLIPLRYIILAWGVNKLTKKLRKPNHIPNNEFQDLISCSPSNHELLEYRELPLRQLPRSPTPDMRRGSPTPDMRHRSTQPRKRSHTLKC